MVLTKSLPVVLTTVLRPAPPAVNETEPLLSNNNATEPMVMPAANATEPAVMPMAANETMPAPASNATDKAAPPPPTKLDLQYDGARLLLCLFLFSNPPPCVCAAECALTLNSRLSPPKPKIQNHTHKKKT